MLILNNDTRSLEVDLDGAVTTNQLPFVVNYTNSTPNFLTSENSNNGATNDTTAVTLLAAPVPGGRRIINSLTIYNADTVNATVSISLNDNGTLRVLTRTTLAVNDTLIYTANSGFYILTSAGSIKSTASAVNLADLGDVTITSPDTNALLTYNGTNWIAGTAGQIVFPATQAPSANANTLDDYEEGPWTPGLDFVTKGDLSVTYTTQLGRYTKIGRLVVVTCNIVTATFTHTTASGDLEVDGLPFTPENVSGLSNFGACSWSGITKASYTNISAWIFNNSTTVNFAASGSAQAVTTVTASDMPTGGTVHLRFTVAYNV